MSDSLNDVWFLMPNWKWLGLAAGLALGFFLLMGLKPIFEALKKRISQRVHPESWFAFLLELGIHQPLAWIAVAAFWMVTINALGLPDALQHTLKVIDGLLLSYSVIHLAYLGADAVGHLMMALARKTENTLDDQLVPFATKTLKAVIIVFGLLITLQNFGLNVVSILAGLGLGGLALALAAQDTAANLFGSVTILMDRPFQVGDYIKVGAFEGNVEDVGFRSTRIRTPTNSLITVPNAFIAKEVIDNLQYRQFRRIRHSIGLTYDATPEKIQQFCQTLAQAWRSHPEADPIRTAVAFQSLGDSTLNMLAQTHVRAQTWEEEMRIQDELLRMVITVAAHTGVDFAFPTQTVHYQMPPNSASAAGPVGPRA